MVATAGIERVVRLHFAIPASLEHTVNNYDDVRPKTRSRVRAMNTAAVVRAIRRNHQPGLLSDSDSDSDSDPDSNANSDTAYSLAPRYDTTQDEVLPTEMPAPPPERTRTAAELADEEAIALFDELLREEESRKLFSSDQFLDSSPEEASNSELMVVLSDTSDSDSLASASASSASHGAARPAVE